jgi:hypothetical protein
MRALPQFGVTIPIFDINRESVSSTALVIDVPPKIWRPKPKACYIPLDPTSEFDDDLFVFRQFGAALYRPRPPFEIDRDDIRLFDPDRDMEEFLAGFRIGNDVDPAVEADIRNIIQRRWDCFYEEGARNSILSFEFAIDTGASAPTCCPKPHYGPHESKIIM